MIFSIHQDVVGIYALARRPAHGNDALVSALFEQRLNL
jgi:hypothetical protein